uniref:Uncharacterized protein n=1 Tax=Aegilops tauschii subsp. strangulata TaxID=200361 RepID=A0A453FLA5_AEGTS
MFWMEPWLEAPNDTKIKCPIYINSPCLKKKCSLLGKNVIGTIRSWRPQQKKINDITMST